MGKHYAVNGWHYWQVGTDGPCLAELKTAYLSEAERVDKLNAANLRAAFWDGFFDCCFEREDFCGLELSSRVIGVRPIWISPMSRLPSSMSCTSSRPGSRGCNPTETSLRTAI